MAAQPRQLLSRAAPRFCRVFDGSEFTTIKMTDLKFTYCFCAHMHEIVKYFILTEIQEQCLNPMPERLIGPGRPAEATAAMDWLSLVDLVPYSTDGEHPPHI